MTELFINVPLTIFDSSLFEKEFRYERYGQAIEYIRVFKCIYQFYMRDIRIFYTSVLAHKLGSNVKDNKS